jgi:hypothetical protein
LAAIFGVTRRLTIPNKYHRRMIGWRDRFGSGHVQSATRLARAGRIPLMKRPLASGLAAILLATAIAAAPEAAMAQQRYYAQERQHYDRGDRGRWDHRGRRHGDAVAAGVAGLVIGAILGGALSSRQRYDQRGYYGDGYGGYDDGYNNGYGYGSGPRTCVTREQRWDDYQGEYVWVERAYPC